MVQFVIHANLKFFFLGNGPNMLGLFSCLGYLTLTVKKLEVGHAFEPLTALEPLNSIMNHSQERIRSLDSHNTELRGQLEVLSATSSRGDVVTPSAMSESSSSSSGTSTSSAVMVSKATSPSLSSSSSPVIVEEQQKTLTASETTAARKSS